MKKTVFILFIALFVSLMGCNSTRANTDTTLSGSYETFIMQSESMSPTIMNGATLTFERTNDIGDYEVGDYVIVSTQNELMPNETLNVVMIIISMQIDSIDGVDQYLFDVGTLNSPETETVEFDDLIGIIVEIDNP